MKHILNMFQLITCANVLVMALAWSFLGVYKKLSHNNILEAFILNLAVYTTVADNFQDNGRNLGGTGGISVGITLATFVAILVYHAYRKLRSIQMCKDLSIWLQAVWMQHELTSKLIQNSNRMECPVSPDQQLPPFARFCEDREPLLAPEDTD